MRTEAELRRLMKTASSRATAAKHHRRRHRPPQRVRLSRRSVLCRDLRPPAPGKRKARRTPRQARTCSRRASAKDHRRDPRSPLRQDQRRSPRPRAPRPQAHPQAGEPKGNRPRHAPPGHRRLLHRRHLQNPPPVGRPRRSPCRRSTISTKSRRKNRPSVASLTFSSPERLSSASGRLNHL